jgi:hypothetical protein
MKELIIIQSKLNVPKDQFNTFGKYKFRNAESILTALKPLLKENNCFVIINDEIVLIGERYYIKATATITNSEDKTISASCFAREEKEQKGMQAPQLSGSTASYAHKYALGALFCIDNEDDPDATNKHDKESQTTKTDTKQPKAEKEKPILLENTLEYDKVILYLNNSDETPYSEKILNIKSKFDISKVVKNFVKR